MPEVVEHNTNTSAVLDCQYDLDGQRDINILTVRWFFKDDFSAPVYQWVKGAKPSSGGALKGLVHLDHEASDDPLMKHRALSISNPTIELGGKYTCKVSTDVGGTATQSGNMIVYGKWSIVSGNTRARHNWVGWREGSRSLFVCHALSKIPS